MSPLRTDTLKNAIGHLPQGTAAAAHAEHAYVTPARRSRPHKKAHGKSSDMACGEGPRARWASSSGDTARFALKPSSQIAWTASTSPLPDVVKKARIFEQTVASCTCHLWACLRTVRRLRRSCTSALLGESFTPSHPDRFHLAIAHPTTPHAHAHPPRRIPRFSARRWPVGY